MRRRHSPEQAGRQPSVSVIALPLRPLETVLPLAWECGSDRTAVTEGAVAGTAGAHSCDHRWPLREGVPCLGAESRWLGELAHPRS